MNDEYFSLFEAFADRLLGKDESVQDLLDREVSSGDQEATKLLECRFEMLSQDDRDRGSAYFDLGWFRNLPTDRRAAAWVLALDLERERGLRDIRRRLSPYAASQPLFNRFPDLLGRARDRELLHFSARDKPEFTPRHDGFVLWGRQALRIDPFLNPALLVWARQAFPTSPLFVRLDPYFVPDMLPQSLLTEAVVVPADPTWWNQLVIYRGRDKGSRYELQLPQSAGDDPESYWEFWVRGVRRLEVHSERRKEEYLTMMVEELVDLRRTNGYLLGRCLHWDTRSRVGEPVSTALTEHLDLSINIYTGEHAERRMAQNLDSGVRVEDANPHTHLLRIERVPVVSLLGFAMEFFTSKVLLKDWVRDQFSASELP